MLRLQCRKQIVLRAVNMISIFNHLRYQRVNMRKVLFRLEGGEKVAEDGKPLGFLLV